MALLTRMVELVRAIHARREALVVAGSILLYVIAVRWGA